MDQQRKGRTLNFYSCSGPAKLLDPYSYYRLQAWHCWQIGATGSFFWAFGDNDRSSSWNEYLAVAGPFAPLMIDDESVVPAKQMEAVRESVEDYEYFVLLRKALERAKAAGRSDAAVAKAQSLLANGASRVVRVQRGKIHWRDAKDRTLADTCAWRFGRQRRVGSRAELGGELNTHPVACPSNARVYYFPFPLPLPLLLPLSSPYFRQPLHTLLFLGRPRDEQ